jgi:oligopeptide transport system substrate-binding protein
VMMEYVKFKCICHWFTFAVFFLIISLGCISCSGDRYDNTGLTVFRYNEAGNITSLDPVFARNQSNIWATSQLFNSLVELGNELEINPAIAQRWDLSEDGLEYTFFLRTDVYFHDNPCFVESKGRRVVASDFVYSLSRLVNPALNSPGSWVMNAVKRNVDGTLDITAPNDTVLIIRLSNPFPPFLGLLSMTYCSAIPFEAIDAYGTDFRKNPVGTGPFRFKYWKEGVKLVFRKNDKYFEFAGEDRLPYLDAVAINFIIDRQTAFLEFIKGNLDFLSSVDASYKDELLTPGGLLQPRYHDRLYKISMPFLNTEYLGILMDTIGQSAQWPLKSKKVRQAINFGFDREKMLTFLRNNIGMPAHAGFVPVGMPGFTDNVGGYHYDADKARRLLAEAGFPGGAGLPPLVLHTNQAYQDIAQYIQHELAKIGIRLEIDVMPPATIREMMAKGDARFFRASWIADYPDAENFLALFYSVNRAPAGPNYTRFTNNEFDKLYIQALAETNDSIRHTLYRKMDHIIIEDAPVVFLFYDQSVRFVPKYVQGMTNNPLNHLDLRRVSIQKHP